MNSPALLEGQITQENRANTVNLLSKGNHSKVPIMILESKVLVNITLLSLISFKIFHLIYFSKLKCASLQYA